MSEPDVTLLTLHPHRLYKIMTTEKWTCSVCRKSFQDRHNENEERFACIRRCDWSACLTCFLYGTRPESMRRLEVGSRVRTRGIDEDPRSHNIVGEVTTLSSDGLSCVVMFGPNEWRGESKMLKLVALDPRPWVLDSHPHPMVQTLSDPDWLCGFHGSSHPDSSDKRSWTCHLKCGWSSCFISLSMTGALPENYIGLKSDVRLCPSALTLEATKNARYRVLSGSVGRIRSLDNDGGCIVSFEEKKRWKGLVTDLIVVPLDPSLVHHGVHPHQVRQVSWENAAPWTCDVCRMESSRVNGDKRRWRCSLFCDWDCCAKCLTATETIDQVLRRFNQGDRVKIKDSVSTPRWNWGELTRASVGVLTQYQPPNAAIADFPEAPGFRVHVFDIERVPSPSTSSSSSSSSASDQKSSSASSSSSTSDQKSSTSSSSSSSSSDQKAQGEKRASLGDSFEASDEKEEDKIFKIGLSAPGSCTMCKKRPVETVNTPCRHSFFCTGCSDRYRSRFGLKCNACGDPSEIIEALRTVDCQICGVGIGLDEIMCVGECGHQYCVGCISQMLKVALGDVNTFFPLRCPDHFSGCTELIHVPNMLPLTMTYNLISRDEYKRILELSVIHAIPKDEHLHCPKCQTFYISSKSSGPRKDEDKFVRCGKCKSKFCLECRNRWHAGTPCVTSEALVDKTSKKCPGCKASITHYLKHGCHHIKCPACSFDFCYVCLQKFRTCSCPMFCTPGCNCPVCPDCSKGKPCPHG